MKVIAAVVAVIAFIAIIAMMATGHLVLSIGAILLSVISLSMSIGLLLK